MRLAIAAIGKLKSAEEQAMAERYIKRFQGMGRGLGFSELVVRDWPESRAQSPDQRKGEESTKLLSAVDDDAFVVMLDERGKHLTSAQFADFLRARRDAGDKSLAFVIGGPDGHGAEIERRAQKVVALSALTFPHGLARVVLLEQIYRAATILAGHPYHRV